MSSANKLAQVVSRYLGKFVNIYKRNRMEPRLNPCGVPHLVSGNNSMFSVWQIFILSQALTPTLTLTNVLFVMF